METIARDPELRRIVFEPRFDVWRDHARHLLVEGVPPEQVDWLPEQEAATAETVGVQQSLLTVPTSSNSPQRSSRALKPSQTDAFNVPKSFIDRARRAACFRDPDRWRLLYRLLWRLTRGGEQRLLAIEVDPDVHRFTRMIKAVRRDIHKMHAFVRFRKVNTARGDGTVEGADVPEETWYIAWHRPEHLILELAAPFFQERFNDQRWSILTPDGSVSWDLEKLTYGAPVPQREAPRKDELEDLWLTYYASIFNPARVNPKAMKAEMPVRHWPTLPEAALIPELLRDAPERQRNMIEVHRRPPARLLIRPDASLGDLAAAVHDCRACELCESGRAVFGEGPPDARLVLVGEQPGDQEERRGRPFVGPAGELLDRALDASGLDRSQLYVTNAVKHFRHRVEQRGGVVRRIHQSPSQTEVRACFPWLDAELKRLQPQGLVTLGATSTRILAGPTLRLKDVRGQFVDRPGNAWLLPTHHPAAILRQPDPGLRRELEAQLIADLLAARQRLAA